MRLLVFVPGEGAGSGVKVLETLVEKGSPPLRVGRSGFLLSIEGEGILFRLGSEVGECGLCLCQAQ